jgi:hypothetical protein
MSPEGVAARTGTVGPKAGSTLPKNPRTRRSGVRTGRSTSPHHGEICPPGGHISPSACTCAVCGCRIGDSSLALGVGNRHGGGVPANSRRNTPFGSLGIPPVVAGRVLGGVDGGAIYRRSRASAAPTSPTAVPSRPPARDRVCGIRTRLGSAVGGTQTETLLKYLDVEWRRRTNPSA